MKTTKMNNADLARIMMKSAHGLRRDVMKNEGHHEHEHRHEGHEGRREGRGCERRFGHEEHREFHGHEGMHMEHRGMRPEGHSGRRQAMKERRIRHRHMMRKERILVYISKQPNGVSQQELLEKADVGPTFMAKLTGILESEGYVERRVDLADANATRLYLTEKGSAYAAEVSEAHSRKFENYFSNLTEEEKQTLFELLSKIAA